MKTALFLLPHVLLYVLLDGSQDDSEEVGYRVSLDVRAKCFGGGFKIAIREL